MNIRCALGIHQWVPIEISRLIMLEKLEYCARCKHGRGRAWTVTLRYDDSEFRELLFAHGASIPAVDPPP